jgi:GntR family transcriptional regulator
MNRTDEVRAEIAADISRGVYLPGTRLPTRHELMERYGLARASVDRIVAALRAEGLVVSTRGSGTYVASAAEGRDVSVFIVLNTDVVCMTSGMMEREWSFIINERGARPRCTVIGCHEIDRFMPAIEANAGARLVWNRPSTRSHATIARLDELGRVQVLINRAIPRYNHVVADVRPALGAAFEHVRTVRPDALLGVLPPYLDPEEHYLAEREIMFYELANAHGFRVASIPRTASTDQSGTTRIARAALDRRPDFLYVPDYYMTPYVLSLIEERGLRFGRDITLITSDWNEAPAATPGMVCIGQRWREMFGVALDWVLRPRPGPLQLRVPSEMRVNGPAPSASRGVRPRGTARPRRRRRPRA